MAPPSKKKKFSGSPTASNQSKTEILTLPNDLLLIIFGELSTEERVPLGTSCKRFRYIDFELGYRSFNEISISYCPLGILAEGETSLIKYKIISDGFNLIERNKTMRLLRKSNTQLMEIFIHKVNIDQSEIEIICDLTKTVKTRKYRIWFACEESNAERYLPLLLRDRNMDKMQVELSWSNKIPKINIAYVRESLINLTKMDTLEIYIASSEDIPKTENDLVLDDVTLFHVVSQVNRSNLGMGDFSIQGILKVFEVVRKSDLPNKYVKFFAKKRIIDELFAMQFNDLEKVRGKLIDRESNTMLKYLQYEHMTCVEMGKVNADGELIEM